MPPKYLEQQKSLGYQGFFLLFRCPLHGIGKDFHIESNQKCLAYRTAYEALVDELA